MTTILTPSVDAEYGSVASQIAAELSASVVTEFNEISDERVLYVASPTDLEETTILELQRRAAETNGRFTYGIFTGRTPESTLQLFERTPEKRDENVLVIRKINRDIFSYDDGTEVLTRDDVTAEKLRSLNEDGLESLSAMINGRGIHSYLTGGYLCGVPSDLDAYELPGEQPNCVEGGTYDCPYDDNNDVLAVDTLDIPHVFYNSCTSMFPNGLTEPPVSVGLSLLENACSVIGGLRTMDGKAHEVALHYSLFRAGYTAGERARILNANADRIALKSFPYAVFGSPDASSQVPTTQRYESAITSNESSFQLILSNVDAHIIDVELPSDVDDVYVRNRTDEHASTPIFYTIVPDQRASRLLIYSWGAMQADELEFEISEDCYRRLERRRLRSSIAGAKRLAELSLLDKKAKGQLENLENQVRNFPAHLESETYHTNAYRELDDRIETVLDGLDHLRSRIVQIFSNRGPGHLSEEYADRVAGVSTDVLDEPCYTCGRPVYTRRNESVHADAERVNGMCPHCAKVFDVPVQNGAVEYPKVRLEEDPAGVSTVSVEFTNPLDVPMEATFFPWLHHDVAENRNADVFTPAERVINLDPDERRTERFELDTAPLDSSDYMVYGYVVGNLDMYVGMTRLLVR